MGMAMGRGTEARACPYCSAQVKRDNLPDHVRRVHPRETVPDAVRRPAAAKDRRLRTPAGGRLRRVAALAVLVLLVAVIAVVYTSLPKPAPYADHFYFDLGNVPQGTTEHKFTLENRGAGPLTITGGSTSCGCTTVQIHTLSEDSPVYGMPGHGAPAPWSGTIPPGGRGEVHVLYDALEHPDYYDGTREAYVETSAGELTYTIRVHEVP